MFPATLNLRQNSSNVHSLIKTHVYFPPYLSWGRGYACKSTKVCRSVSFCVAAILALQAGRRTRSGSRVPVESAAPYCSDRLTGPPSPLSNGNQKLSSAMKRQGCEPGHSPSTSAEGKKSYIYASTHPPPLPPPFALGTTSSLTVPSQTKTVTLMNA